MHLYSLDRQHILAGNNPTAKKMASPSLLDLPDPCLLVVLQCCANDSQPSLFSAARAHSRLHKTAAVLHSFKAVLHEQQQVNSALFHLSKHGTHTKACGLFCMVTMAGFRGQPGCVSCPHACSSPAYRLMAFNSSCIPGVTLGACWGLLQA